jgi:hypothetical protein
MASLIMAAMEPFSMGGAGMGAFCMGACAVAMPVQSAAAASVATKRFIPKSPEYNFSGDMHG